MTKLSAETKDTIIQVWRASMVALVLGVGGMIWSANERSQATAQKVNAVEKSVDDGARDVKAQITSMASTLDVLRTSVMKTESAISLSVLRILEEHTRQIGDLQTRDARQLDELASLRVQIARLEAELGTFRRAMDTPPSRGGRP